MFNSDQSHAGRPMQFDQHVLQYHFSCLFVIIATDILTHNSITVHSFNVVTIQHKTWQRDNEIQEAWKVTGRNEMERCMCLLSDTITSDVHFALLTGWRIRTGSVGVSREPRANQNQITPDWIISILLLHYISLLSFCAEINWNFPKDLPKHNHSEWAILAGVLSKQHLLTQRFVSNRDKSRLELGIYHVNMCRLSFNEARGSNRALESQRRQKQNRGVRRQRRGVVFRALA